MFVKKLVVKASKKPGRRSSTEEVRANDVEPPVPSHYEKPSEPDILTFQNSTAISNSKLSRGSSSEGIRANDMEPRVAFHYGIPSGSDKLAYDPFQNSTAISTKDGRIKLFGKDQSQVLLDSQETAPSRFLQFIHNQGFLLNVTSKNHLEVWDIDKRVLCHVHVSKEEITSFCVLQNTPYICVGNSSGDVSILKFKQDSAQIVQMEYTIPYSTSNGSLVEVSDKVVTHILPQPTAETSRILITFRGGFITLWDIKESKPIFKTGRSVLQSLKQEHKELTSACWVCPYGSKVAAGYNNGNILIWSVPSAMNLRSEGCSESGIRTSPICKLNLGYKSEKISIASMKWTYGDGKGSRLYVMGSSANLLQVVLLNEQTENRTIKLSFDVSEVCKDMEIITAPANEQGKHKHEFLIVLGKSGHLYAYDDHKIMKYLQQSQTKSSPSLPKQFAVKIPFAGSKITVTKLITNSPHLLNPSEEDYLQLLKEVPSLFPLQTASNKGYSSNSTHFSGFTKVKRLFIAGHNDGTISFWDMSCPFLIPVLSLKQQNEEDCSSTGATLTALHFDGNARLLVSGDCNGWIHIYKFKPEPFAAKKNNTHVVQNVKHVKVNGFVNSLNTNQTSTLLAVGSDQGHVSLVDIENSTVLYQTNFASEICREIISLSFRTCSLHGFGKKMLMVAMKDSSILALDSNSGNMLAVVRPKKPYKALFMQILGPDGSSMNKDSLAEDVIPKQPSVLLCTERAVYIYSLRDIVQGAKKALHKKKFNSSCSWGSTFNNGDSGICLMLLYPDGTIEIRSLPELSLLQQLSVRGFTYSSSKQNLQPETTICSSPDGDLVMLNGDQELFAVSILIQKNRFQLLDTISQVYRKELMHEDLASGVNTPKEKKKGGFASVFWSKSKTKQITDLEVDETKELSAEELSMIFSTANFPDNIEIVENQAVDEEETELQIDDIDLGPDLDFEDHIEQSKEASILSGINKQSLKLAKMVKKQTGKLKPRKAKNDKIVQREETVEEKLEEKPNAVDQIKKKYGFASSGEFGAAKMAESKLRDNVQKLQGISLRTAEIEETAKSFNSMAKELLNSVEHNKQIPKPLYTSIFRHSSS